MNTRKTATNRMTGKGIPRTLPLPINFRRALFPRPEIGFPFMKIMVMPRNAVMVISVAMKGCRRPLVTSVPLIMPKQVPMASVRSIAIPTGMPPLIKVAQNAMVRASTDPTDRSMPPVRMTQVMPNAMKPLMEDCLTSDMKLSIVRNCGLMALITITRRISAISAPRS